MKVLPDRHQYDEFPDQPDESVVIKYCMMLSPNGIEPLTVRRQKALSVTVVWFFEFRILIASRLPISARVVYSVIVDVLYWYRLSDLAYTELWWHYLITTIMQRDGSKKSSWREICFCCGYTTAFYFTDYVRRLMLSWFPTPLIRGHEFMARVCTVGLHQAASYSRTHSWLISSVVVHRAMSYPFSLRGYAASKPFTLQQVANCIKPSSRRQICIVNATFFGYWPQRWTGWTP